MNKLKEVDQTWRESIRVNIALNSGLLAIPVIAVIQLLQVPESSFDVPLIISVYVFAISIPTLAIQVWAATRTATYSHLVTLREYSPSLNRILNILGELGRIAAMAGMICIFWHFSWIAGTMFLSIGIVSIIVVARYFAILDEATEEAKKDLVRTEETKKASSS